MDANDLAKLTPYDFERLCKSIFEQVLDLRLEIFGPGKDGGVDLRRYSNGDADSQTLVIQCKNWFKSGRDALMRHYREREAAKVRKLQPSRYILATSAVLNPGWKDRLQELLEPHVLATEDIWGADEIVAYLEEHPEIVRQHLRLWLSSSTVLQEMLNNDVRVRSRSLSEDIEEALLTYVPSPAHAAAIDLLDRHRICMISGIPGSGKSTLARALVAQYMNDGYRVIDASGEIADVDRVWNEDENQIVYLDDFLGHTRLEESKAATTSQKLLPLLRRVRRDAKKCAVLTTRDYIFNEAAEVNDELANFNLTPRTCTIDLNDYARILKAEILYNHIHWSSLSPSQKAEFGDSAKYTPVLSHPNYSPRLIEHAIKEVLDLDEGESAVEALMENLRNPRRLWQRLIENVLEDDAVMIVYSLFTLGSRINSSWLEDAWRTYRGYEVGAISNRTFSRHRERLERTALRDVSRSDELPLYSFHNPSVEDFLRVHISERPAVLQQLISQAIGLRQLENLWKAGRGADGVLWLAAAVKHAGEFASAAIRIHPPTHEMDDKYSPMEIAILLTSIANEARNEELARLVLSLTENEGFYAASDERLLSELVLSFKKSPLELLRTQELEQLEFLLELIDDNSHGWDEGQSALSILESHLDDSERAKELREEIRDRLMDEAVETVTPWADEDVDQDYYSIGLQECVNWLEEQGTHCEGLDEAKSYLRRQNDRPASSTDHRVVTPSGDIDDMMSALREENE